MKIIFSHFIFKRFLLYDVKIKYKNMIQKSRSGAPGTYCIWQGGGRTTLRRNHSAGQRDFPIHWHKMDRGKGYNKGLGWERRNHSAGQRDFPIHWHKMDRGTWQSVSDSDVYENVPGTKEPREMMRIQQESKGENLSPKALKASEMLGTQRRLLMVLVTLLVLVFMFLIILTCLMLIYYSTVSRQLQQEHEEKANLLTQITAINQTLDKWKTNLLTQITTINQRLDSRISEVMKSIKQDILQTIRKERPQCDSGWKSFDGSCYYIVTTKKNWKDAQAICKSMNSDLVIIDSQKEQKFLENITDYTNIWIGLTRDNNCKNLWIWVDGTLHLSDGFWGNNQPDNEGENCVQLLRGKKWHDYDCTDQYEAICEKKLIWCV
uniref:C-type lectin domain-containing protein n=1 Tax=Xenopus tropicalis TaxID=8364 RepID=A0A803JVU1_XENTR